MRSRHSICQITTNMSYNKQLQKQKRRYPLSLTITNAIHNRVDRGPFKLESSIYRQPWSTMREHPRTKICLKVDLKQETQGTSHSKIHIMTAIPDSLSSMLHRNLEFFIWNWKNFAKIFTLTPKHLYMQPGAKVFNIYIGNL